MVTFTLFTLSGAALIMLTLAKRMEEKKRMTNFILRAISRGDERARAFHHQAVHWYSEGKTKAAFFIKKQLPMRSRNTFNKLVTMLQEESRRYAGTMRDSRLLKKSDGISEFFKSMSEVEKGAGEINEGYESAPVETVSIPEPVIIKQITEPVVPKPKRKYTKRKVKLTVRED